MGRLGEKGAWTGIWKRPIPLCHLTGLPTPPGVFQSSSLSQSLPWALPNAPNIRTVITSLLHGPWHLHVTSTSDSPDSPQELLYLFKRAFSEHKHVSHLSKHLACHQGIRMNKTALPSWRKLRVLHWSLQLGPASWCLMIWSPLDTFHRALL